MHLWESRRFRNDAEGLKIVVALLEFELAI